jgi:hypothetical protein
MGAAENQCRISIDWPLRPTHPSFETVGAARPGAPHRSKLLTHCRPARA